MKRRNPSRQPVARTRTSRAGSRHLAPSARPALTTPPTAVLTSTPPAEPSTPVPCVCAGLTISNGGAIWRNSIGQEFDLAKERRRTPGEVAIAMRRSTEWVLRKIRSGELFPVCRHNPRFVEVFDCSIADYLSRHLSGPGGLA